MTLEQQLEVARRQWDVALDRWEKVDQELEYHNKTHARLVGQSESARATAHRMFVRWVKVSNRIAATQAAYHNKDTSGFEV